MSHPLRWRNNMKRNIQILCLLSVCFGLSACSNEFTISDFGKICETSGGTLTDSNTCQCKNTVCPKGVICENDKCANIKCEENSNKCEINTLYRCSNGQWSKIGECDSCDDNGQCIKNIECNQEDHPKCENGILYECNENRMETLKSCLNGASCKDKNECFECGDNATKCEGNILYNCKDGAWNIIQECESCINGQCINNTECKQEDHPKCENGILYTCNSDHKETLNLCSNGAECKDEHECHVCKNNATKCEGNKSYTCNSGEWTEISECDSCENGQCIKHTECQDNVCTNFEIEPIGSDKSINIGILYNCETKIQEICPYNATCKDDNKTCNDCGDGATKCEGSIQYQCSEGNWDNGTQCPNGATCKDNKTCNACGDGATKCEDSTQYTCENGTWDKGTQCENNATCKNAITCTDCGDGATKCEGSIQYLCSEGNWDNGTQCPNGATCKDNKTCNACGDGATKCEDSTQYTCENGTWDKGTQCSYGCNGDKCQKKCIEVNKTCVNITDSDTNTDIFGELRWDCQQSESDTTVVLHQSQLCYKSSYYVGTSNKLSCNKDMTDCGECLNGDTKCEDGKEFTCNNGTWDKGTQCENNATCKNDITCNDCGDGATKCENSTQYTCKNETWDKGTQCEYGCYKNTCSECLYGDIKCINNNQKTCVAGKWVDIDCRNGCDDNLKYCNDYCEVKSGESSESILYKEGRSEECKKLVNTVQGVISVKGKCNDNTACLICEDGNSLKLRTDVTLECINNEWITRNSELCKGVLEPVCEKYSDNENTRWKLFTPICYNENGTDIIFWSVTDCEYGCDENGCKQCQPETKKCTQVDDKYAILYTCNDDGAFDESLCSENYDINTNTCDNKCSENGSTICVNGILYGCKETSWEKIESCEFGCSHNYPTCNLTCTGRKCENDPVTKTGIVFECDDINWNKGKASDDGNSCRKDGLNYGECKNGDKKCDGDRILVCKDGEWVFSAECTQCECINKENVGRFKCNNNDSSEDEKNIMCSNNVLCNNNLECGECQNGEYESYGHCENGNWNGSNCIEAVTKCMNAGSLYYKFKCEMRNEKFLWSPPRFCGATPCEGC